MSDLIPNPQTSPTPIPQTTGQGFDRVGMSGPPIEAPQSDDPNFQVAPLQGFGIPSQNALPSTLDLGSVAPAGAYTDSQFLADDTGLRSNITQQYAKILQQLGYHDPNSGVTVPGTVVQDANIQLGQYQHDMQQALIGAIQNLQQSGTYWSGQHATQVANAQYPIVNNMAQLQLNTGRTLNDLYNQAQGLVGDYNTQRNQFLAQAAARQLAALQAMPPAPAASTGGDGDLTKNWSTAPPAPAAPPTAPGGGSYIPYTGPDASQPNQDYAASDTGQSMIQQIYNDPAEAGASGAAGVLTGQTGVNWQAMKQNVDPMNSYSYTPPSPPPAPKPAPILNPRATKELRNERY